jgi:hypothetical protein
VGQLKLVIVTKEEATTASADERSVPVGAVRREVLCVNQGVDFMRVVTVVNDRINAYMLPGDGRIVDDHVAVSNQIISNSARDACHLDRSLPIMKSDFAKTVFPGRQNISVAKRVGRREILAANYIATSRC